jgi:hypothetical protein
MEEPLDVKWLGSLRPQINGRRSLKCNWQTGLVLGGIVAGSFFLAEQAGVDTRPYALTLSILTAAVLIRRQFRTRE